MVAAAQVQQALRSFDVDLVAHNPKLQLLEPILPARFELANPIAVVGGVGYVDDEPDEVVAVCHRAMPPVPFDLLRLVAGGTEALDDFEHGLGESIGRDLPTVIEPKGKQNLEPPPTVAHRSPSP